MTKITKDNIKDFVKEYKVCMLDFWADWCGPCKMLSPILEEIEEESKEYNFAIGKINVDEERELATAFDIRTIPTLLIVIDGEIKDGVIGAIPKNLILEKLEKYL